MDAYTPEEQQILLATAQASLKHGVAKKSPMPVNLSQFQGALVEKRATFVTLEKQHQLRGCIGSLQAYQPLIKDVADNAFKSGFMDRRFNKVEASELQDIDIHISVLTPAKAMSFNDEADLLSQLVPKEDGLILADNNHRGTFLPTVWQSLPTPEIFFRQLKVKAGLPQDYWSDTLQVYRYHTVLIKDEQQAAET